MRYSCSLCPKTFAHRSSRSRHLALCKKDTSHQLINDMPNVIKSDTRELIDTMNQFIAQQAQLIATVQNTPAVSIDNRSVNLTVFLNQTCKDAMTIHEFANNVEVALTDLEEVCERGVVSGISDVILRNLNAIDVTKRPVHCSNAARETIHVNDGAWRDAVDSRVHMMRIIDQVLKQNMRNIVKWKTCNVSEARDTDKLSNMVIASVKTSEADRKKILSRVARGTVINNDIAVK